VTDYRDRVLLKIPPATRCRVVSEGRIRTYKDIVLQPDSIPELNTRLDRDTVSDDHIVLNESMVTDVTVRPDGRAGQNVSEGPHAGTVPDILRLEESLLVYEYAALTHPGLLVG
jgi:hypothetical protein